ncbi:hypothetical protein IC762_17525 [Bradyrhizobium genosp. L]|uniref:hypothetical protein n=1 Tax=Bradyrhizobium genosp. L TaxID=83637 RepID=UPI0018A2735E|nr:hypothetical protein [Bradyrhizobium genosp. L]QPF81627.1 hypothetical protein IC762_17525 [Bradyrhizobium genosp. L]
MAKSKPASVTIDDVYAAINPLPAMLSEKGKVKPNVDLKIEANAGIYITLSWVKPHVQNDWDRNYQVFQGDDFADAVGKARAYIKALPSAEQAKLHAFMGQLGKLIDAGRSDGIAVDYLNPLLGSMKRLSENVITYQPKGSK